MASCEGFRQLLEEEDPTLFPQGGLGKLGSSSSPFVLVHCLEAERKPGRPGPASERSPFLLLCNFLFRPAAILDAPGGPVLIRVLACSRAVPEGCVAMQFQSESGRAEQGWGQIPYGSVGAAEEGAAVQSDVKGG